MPDESDRPASTDEPPTPTERQIAALAAGFTAAAGKDWPVLPNTQPLPPELASASDEQVVFEALVVVLR